MLRRFISISIRVMHDVHSLLLALFVVGISDFNTTNTFVTQASSSHIIVASGWQWQLYNYSSRYRCSPCQ